MTPLPVRYAALTASVVVVVSGALAVPSASAETGRRVVRVSVGNHEQQSGLGERYPERPSISGSGRFVTFVSKSPHLVRNDTNGAADVFVRDRLKRTTRLVSVGRAGRQAPDGAGEAVISANGRRVVFTTASALVRRDRNGTVDVYVRDLWTHRTALVSQRPDGRAGNGPSFLASPSRSGRYIAFQSSASNLVRRDKNRVEDAFLRDVVTGRTRRLSVLPAGYGQQTAGFEPRVSPNGRWVLFGSLNSDDSTTLWVRDTDRRRTKRVSTGVTGHASVGSWSMSAHARYVAFITDRGLVPDDTNGEVDAYRVDRRTGDLLRLSVSSSGRQGTSYSDTVELSADGRVAAFSSGSANLVRGDTNDVVDVFKRNIRTGKTRRVSVSTSGRQANGDSAYVRDLAISADGRHIAFASFADNLVPRDTNDDPDVFVWERVRAK